MNVQPHLVADSLDFGRRLVDAEVFGQLIEDAQFAMLRGVFRGKLHTLQRVLQVQVTTHLIAFSVHGERDAGDGLHQEAIDG